MPQHLWETANGMVRVCEVCRTSQIRPARDSNWTPPVDPICPGDPEDGGRLTPAAPAPSPRRRAREGVGLSELMVGVLPAMGRGDSVRGFREPGAPPPKKPPRLPHKPPANHPPRRKPQAVTTP
jgi:hypothetical protein